MKRVIAYIDGFNLYHGLRDQHWQRFYWLNVWKLAESLIPPDSFLSSVNYYTAVVVPPKHDPDKQKRQTTYIDALRTLPNVQVVLGHYLKKQITCNFCSGSWTSYEEKCTDVNIACQMLIDSYENRYDILLLISADGDLKKPLSCIHESFSDKRIVVAFPPRRDSAELRRLAHSCLHVDRTNLNRSLFPDKVVTTCGFVLHRPTTWR